MGAPLGELSGKARLRGDSNYYSLITNHYVPTSVFSPLAKIHLLPGGGRRAYNIRPYRFHHTVGAAICRPLASPAIVGEGDRLRW